MITTAALPAATLGALYRHELRAWGGTPPYHWTLVDGALPRGLRLTDAGEVQGVPLEEGTFAMSLKVSDSSASRYHGGPQAFVDDQRLTVEPAS